MKENNDLFDLIQAMTASEKRYFKLEASRQKGDKQYLKLFDFLSKQKAYDEKATIKKLSKGMDRNKYNFTRNYLYNTLLDSLQNFHSKSMETRIKDLLLKSEILHRKRLKSQSEKLLKKAKKLAGDHHETLALIETLRLENKLLTGAVDEEKMKRQENIAEEITILLGLMDQEVTSNLLGARLAFMVNFHGSIRTEEHVRELGEIMSHPLFEKLENGGSLSYAARNALLRSKAIYYMKTAQWEDMEVVSQEIIDQKEQNPVMIRKDPEEYLGDITAIANSQFAPEKEHQFFANIEKIRAIPERLPANKITTNLLEQIFFSSFVLEYNFYLRNFQMEKAFNRLGDFWEGYSRYEKTLLPEWKIYLLYHAALTYMANNAYGKALEWFNYILNEFKSDLVAWAFQRIHLLLLVIHYELGHHRLLESLIPSTYRMLLRKERLFKYEQTILKFIRKLPDAVNEKTLKTMFGKLKDDLKEVAKDPTEKGYCVWFIYWLEGKEKGTSLKEVFLEKGRDKRNLLVA